MRGLRRMSRSDRVDQLVPVTVGTPRFLSDAVTWLRVTPARRPSAALIISESSSPRTVTPSSANPNGRRLPVRLTSPASAWRRRARRTQREVSRLALLAIAI